MTTSTITILNAMRKGESSNGGLKGVEYNKVTGAHLEAAAKHRLDAVKSYQSGDLDQADLSSFAALRHLLLAGDV